MSEQENIGWLYATWHLGLAERLMAIGMLIPFIALASLTPKNKILGFLYGVFVLYPAFYAPD